MVLSDMVRGCVRGSVKECCGNFLFHVENYRTSQRSFLSCSVFCHVLCVCTPIP